MRTIAFFALLLMMTAGCRTPELTPDQRMALRQAQTRSFEVPFGTVFKATITYLQDNAYQIRQAAKDAGVISAYKTQDLSGSEKFWGAFLIGPDAKKGDAYDVTFTFEQIDDANTSVRLNITHGSFNLAGRNTDVQAVTDVMLYKGVMDALSLEVQRKNMIEQMRKKAAPTG